MIEMNCSREVPMLTYLKLVDYMRMGASDAKQVYAHFSRHGESQLSKGLNASIDSTSSLSWEVHNARYQGIIISSSMVERQ